MKLHYVASALESKEWPRLLDPRGEPLPEVALAGRSNVGKSTFINLLSGLKKKMAKISSTPGKTQRLQFFVADDKFVLVDLPGYGFASAPKAAQIEWSKAIDLYLLERASLKLTCLLLDIRRDLTPDDLAMIHWAKSRMKLLLPVFTKTDMLRPSEQAKRVQVAKEQLLPYGLLEPLFVPAPSKHLSQVIYEHLR